jgi:hypothetical protein
MGALLLIRLSHQGANAVTVGNKITPQVASFDFIEARDLESLDHSSKTSPFSGHAQKSPALQACHNARLSPVFGRATRKIKY